MQDLCKNYDLKAPKFMSIDIEGVDYMAISNIDFKDSQCAPEFLMVEANKLYETAGYPSTEPYIKKQGYTELHRKTKLSINKYYVQTKLLA